MRLQKTICASCGKLVFRESGICILCGSGLSQPLTSEPEIDTASVWYLIESVPIAA